MHKKSLVMLLILLSLLSCKEDVQLEPEEVVNAFLEAVENQDASNLVSYLSEGEISILEPFVEEIKSSNNPDQLLAIADIELSENEIRNLNAKTLYILSFEASWEAQERMGIADMNIEYIINSSRISGDSAFVEVTRRIIHTDETNIWVLLLEDGCWKIDSYKGL